MIRIGCHLSSSRGYLAMGETAADLHAGTFQFFTRNPRGGKAKAQNPADVAAYLKYAKEHDIAKPLAHAPYTMNACAADEKIREFARETMADDLMRLQSIPDSNYNFHPGSHVGQGTETGIAKIAEILNAVLKEEQNTTVLLETMAGKGSEIGGCFEEIRELIDRVTLKEHLGVTLDTCHVWDAGYDIVHDLDGVLDEFDRVIGLGRLRAVHINDSKNPLGSHKDRHEKIGEGYIGLPAFERIVRHPALRGLPFYLETPNELSGYAEEIALLKEKSEG